MLVKNKRNLLINDTGTNYNMVHRWKFICPILTVKTLQSLICYKWTIAYTEMNKVGVESETGYNRSYMSCHLK